MLTVYNGYATVSSKLDDGFKSINKRLDKSDEGLGKIDSKIDGWVKWGTRFVEQYVIMNPA